ncbi:MAG: hypothetical protein WED07_03280 [Candidatus Freyarchaeum deiterrae]
MNEAKTKDKQDRTIEILEEILKWTRVTSFSQVKKLLLEILPSYEEKVTYHHSDGRGSQEVAKFAGISHVTVTKWWKIWAKAGIAEMMSVKGGERARRIFSLEDFGIEVQQSKEIETEKVKAEPPIKLEKQVQKTLEEKT